MVATKIRLRHPNGASVTYFVRLDKRLGMPTKETYEAEVARIVKMGEEAGAEVTVETVGREDGE